MIQRIKTEKSLKQITKQLILVFYFYQTMGEDIKQLYISKHSPMCEKQIILLINTGGEKVHYLGLKNPTQIATNKK